MIAVANTLRARACLLVVLAVAAQWFSGVCVAEDRHLIIESAVSVQGRFFAQHGVATNDRSQQSVAADANISWTNADRTVTFTAKPFVRADDQDNRRSHVDLREFSVSAVGAGFELHAGLRRVFWGVNEFLHLVDVINQVDLVEDIDQEDRLGQPMIELVVPRGQLAVEVYVLPGFRKERFPGPNGRLRGPLPIAGNARYAAHAGSRHIDGALRLSGSVGALDFGIAHFAGTSREPRLLPEVSSDGHLQLVPFYETIDQTSIDAQWLWTDWAFKLEALTRQGQGHRYAAAVLGFERTFVGALGRGDVGWVMELLRDSRGRDAPPGHYEHDLALGFRLTANDAADSTLLLGVIQDLQHAEHTLSLEGSRRLGTGYKIAVEARAFGGHSSGGPLNSLTDSTDKTALLDPDDYVQIELTSFF